jgi:UDP-glucose 4-epimerase
VPIDENLPPDASPLRAPYAASKLAAEAYCRAYAQAYGINFIIPRLFNKCRPGQRNNYAGVIQRFIEKVLRLQRCLA